MFPVREKNSVVLTTLGKMHEICCLCLFLLCGCITKLVPSGNGFPFLHKNVGKRDYYNEYLVL